MTNFRLIFGLIATAVVAAGGTYWFVNQEQESAAAPAMDQALISQFQQQANQLNALTEKIEKMDRTEGEASTQASDELLQSLSARVEELANQMEEKLATPVEQTDASAGLTEQLDGFSGMQSSSGLTESIESMGRTIVEQRAEVNERFQLEGVDEEWAPSVEEGLNQSMTKPELEGVEVVSSECRSSLCRVEIIHSSNDPVSREILELEMGILLLDELPSMMMDHTDEPDGRIRSVFLYGRRGQSLYRSGDAAAGLQQ